MVQNLGHDAKDVASAEDALTLLEEEEFDVVVTDNFLGPTQLRGIELLSNLRRTAPHVGRILVTGHAEFELVQRAINQAGIHSFLAKPITAERLSGALSTAMTRAGRV